MSMTTDPKSVQGIIHYDDDEKDGWDEFKKEYLTDMCKNLIFKYGTIAKYGFFGAWNGPQGGGSLITDAKTLYGHITQDFSMQMSWDLSYVDKAMRMQEIQRYSYPVPIDVPAGSLLLRQWHHDGCNCYILRPIKKGHTYGGRTNFLEWCDKYTKRVDLKGVI